MTPHAWKQIGFEMNEDGQKRTAVNMFRCGVGGPGFRDWGAVCARVWGLGFGVFKSLGFGV
jgi:hypothetical protein